MRQSYRADAAPHAVSRRGLLKRAAGVGFGSALVTLLAACSSAPPASQPPASAPPTAPAKSATPATSAPASAPKPAAGTPARGGALRIAITPEAGELNILKPTNVTTRQYARAFYNALTRVDAAGNVTGELAESWSIPDAKTYLFKLRSGIKFHDGTAFDAEAVKFNMDWVMNPENKGNYRSELAVVGSVDVVDSLTVKLSLKQPDITLPSRLSDGAGWMIAPSGIKQFGDQLSTRAVGTGPFELVEWVKGDHLTLKRFEGHWEKDEQGNRLPYLDTVTFKPITDPTVMLTNVRTGNVDLIQGILPADLPKVSADANLASVQGPGNAQVLFLNGEPFTNKALRHAVSWAIDREAIHKAIYFGTGSPGQYVLPPQNWGFDPKAAFYTLDLNKARAKLSEAGQPNGFKFTGMFNNAAIDLQVAQAIQGQLAEVGIVMEVLPLDASTFTDRRKNAAFQAGLSVVTPRADPGENTTRWFKTGSSQNYNKYSNPKLDEMLAQAAAETDQAKRKTLYSQVQALLLDEAWSVFIHNDADIKVMTKAVQGYSASVDGMVRLPRLWLQKS